MSNLDEQDPLDIICRAGDALQAALMHRDEYTQAHCERVSQLALQIGRQCKLGQRELGSLRVAAIFHDIGKIGVPDRVLLKEGRLDAAEYEIMKTHSVIGASIVQKIDLPEAAEAAGVIRWHHEHMDGSGYPDGLRGEAIPVAARIISVVDAFDALTSQRCYRSALTAKQALGRMREAIGNVFDPYIFDKFLQCL
jgi:putative nucleotidyltransferase with HDIG domain